jgi:hypothetical protein
VRVLAAHRGIHVREGAAVRDEMRADALRRGDGAGGEQRQQSQSPGPRNSAQIGSPGFGSKKKQGPRRNSSSEASGRFVAAGGRVVADRVWPGAGLAGPSAEIFPVRAKDFARLFIFALETLVF